MTFHSFRSSQYLLIWVHKKKKEEENFALYGKKKKRKKKVKINRISRLKW